ncbi:MAG: response regulator [Bacteroidales bacterium]
MDSEPLGEIDSFKYDFGGINILVVEDDRINVLLLKRALENVNANVLLANNGAEAVEFVKSDLSIKAVLMDIKMPVMDGLDATKVIKTINSGLPIVAQTAYAQSSEREKAMAVGCDAYLTKPINIALLYKTLVQFL